MEIVICILAVSLVLIGLAGTILPMLPGVPLVFAGLLLAAWSNRFESVGWPVLAVLALLALLSVLVDFTASSLGAKRVGASRAAILGAGLGAGFGMFLGLPGLLLGPFVGAALGQFLARRELRDAARAGFGAWLGFLVGSLAKLALGLVMILVFAVAWFV